MPHDQSDPSSETGARTSTDSSADSCHSIVQKEEHEPIEGVNGIEQPDETFEGEAERLSEVQPAANIPPHAQVVDIPPMPMDLPGPVSLKITVPHEKVKFIPTEDSEWFIEFEYQNVKYAIRDIANDPCAYVQLIEGYRYQDTSRVRSRLYRPTLWQDDD